MRKSTALLMWGISWRGVLLAVLFLSFFFFILRYRPRGGGELVPLAVMVSLAVFIRLGSLNSFFLTRPVSRTRWFWMRAASTALWLALWIGASILLNIAVSSQLASPPRYPLDLQSISLAGIGIILGYLAVPFSMGLVATSLWTALGTRSLPVIGAALLLLAGVFPSLPKHAVESGDLSSYFLPNLASFHAVLWSFSGIAAFVASRILRRCDIRS